MADPLADPASFGQTTEILDIFLVPAGTIGYALGMNAVLLIPADEYRDLLFAGRGWSGPPRVTDYGVSAKHLYLDAGTERDWRPWVDNGGGDKALVLAWNNTPIIEGWQRAICTLLDAIGKASFPCPLSVWRHGVGRAGWGWSTYLTNGWSLSVPNARRWLFVPPGPLTEKNEIEVPGLAQEQPDMDIVPTWALGVLCEHYGLGKVEVANAQV